MLDFVKHPRLSDLAQRIDQLTRASTDPGLPAITRSVEAVEYKLSFSQEGIWRHCQKSEEAHRGYTVARSQGFLSFGRGGVP